MDVAEQKEEEGVRERGEGNESAIPSPSSSEGWDNGCGWVDGNGGEGSKPHWLCLCK